MTITLSAEIEAFNRVLAEYGYTNDNFELISQQEPYPPCGTVGPITGYLTVQHRESGVARTYIAGSRIDHGSPSRLPGWVEEFKNDLEAKVFTS